MGVVSAMKLQDRVALITGAGSGIGRATARLFASEGARLVLVDVVPAGLEQAVAEIRAAGGTATAVLADISKADEVARMIDAAVSAYGRLDVLFNNAGVMDRVLPVADCPDEVWDRVLGINLNGPFYACRRAVPLMLAQGGGVIINTASIGGIRGGVAGAAYTTSKHGLIGLTRNIAAFYATQGIRCNAICPGGVNTQIGLGGEPNAEAVARLMKLAETNPRTGEPEEIARVALFLASDDSSMVNGCALVADAGWSVM
jgi:NAD(P)-dependent dehydrogenase (short-subunit alcohol dehydrogenase family)